VVQGAGVIDVAGVASRLLKVHVRIVDPIGYRRCRGWVSRGRRS